MLRDVRLVARVRVCTPIDVRERVVIERDHKDRSAARKEIERNDAAHKRTLQAAYGVDREDPLLYDLVLNTERTSIDTCVKVFPMSPRARSSRKPRPRVLSFRTRPGSAHSH